MEKITLTKEMLTTAQDYMPTAEKEQWVSETAPMCFDKLAISSNGECYPPMYMLNCDLQSRYLMTALVSKYFGQKYEADETDPELISPADYDKWAGGHIFGQIDRWKHDKDVRNKAYDLLDDYYDLRWRLTTQANGLLNAQNDTVLRQQQLASVQLEKLPEMMQLLKEVQESRENDGIHSPHIKEFDKAIRELAKEKGNGEQKSG